MPSPMTGDIISAMLRRTLVLVFLAWLAADVMTPEIPGAFAFHADALAEGIDTPLGHLAPKTDVPPPVAPKVPLESVTAAEREPAPRLLQRPADVSAHRTVNRLPRAACGVTVRPSEDPH